ncbi:hypothetical protein V6N12_051019 [Hibiscus sabdariffa]|uniref:Uncharacterized protein n=1 Tax=Hibiscus sabdariffa TaxID=183260 RepID=A0ABR2GE18_9ROSI
MKCFEVRWADVVASGLEEVARVEAELGLTSDQVNEGYNLDMGLETSKIRPSIDNWADEKLSPLSLEVNMFDVFCYLVCVWFRIGAQDYNGYDIGS